MTPDNIYGPEIQIDIWIKRDTYNDLKYWKVTFITLL